MAKAIDRASLIVGVLAAFIVAGIGNYFYFGDLLGDMDRESQVLRAVTERFMVERSETWEFGSDRLRARLEPYIDGKLSYRVVTLNDEIVAEIQRSPGSTLFSKRKDIQLFGQPAGYVEAGIGLWTPVLLCASLCVFGLGLGTFLVGILRKRPLSVLRETSNTIIHTQFRLQQMNDRLESIREDERKHLAREIHDEIGQQLTGMKLKRLPRPCRCRRTWSPCRTLAWPANGSTLAQDSHRKAERPPCRQRRLSILVKVSVVSEKHGHQYHTHLRAFRQRFCDWRFSASTSTTRKVTPVCYSGSIS